jgi:ATP-binding cassette subfamily B protein
MTAGGTSAAGGSWSRAARLVWAESPALTLSVVILSTLAGLVPSMTVSLTEQVVGGVTRYGGTGDLGAVTTPAVAMLLVGVAAFVVATVQGYAQSLLQIRLANRVNLAVVEKATAMDLQQFESAGTYDSLQRATREAGTRPYQLFMDALGVLVGTVSLLSVAAVLFTWDPWIAVLLIVSCLPALAAEVFFGRVSWKVEHDRSSMRRWASYLQFLTTNDRNVKEVKSFRLGQMLVNRYARVLQDFYVVDRSIQRREAWVTGLAGVVNVSVSGTAILLAALSAARSGDVGQLAGYIAAVTAVQSAATAVFLGLGQMYEHRLFLGELFSFLDAPEQLVLEGVRPFPDELRTGIEFRDVGFVYPGTTTPALEHVSFTARPGEVVAFVGRNGAGKSTITKLVNRLYDPTSGCILLDGHPLTEYDVESLRRGIGVAFQDFVQYETSVEENVNFGAVERLGDVANSDVALRRSGADFVERLPSGASTRLGRWFEDAQQLSTGQWQRLAVARALAGRAGVILLDEPTAAVDAETESALFARLREVSGGAICLLVSHRFSTVRIADRIHVLDAGTIVESGTHDELVRIDGVYSAMFALQAAGYAP